MQRPISGACSACNPAEEILPINDACVCPPLGEPKFLPIVAPVVFDECGINLCRQIDIDPCIIEKYPDTDAIELKVIDIDFSFCKEDGSKVEIISKRPNCIKVRLARLCVKFAAKLLDSRCKVIGEICFEEDYLPCQGAPGYDEDTNPSSVNVELYAPYGVSYHTTCDECKPRISFLGFVESPHGNNSLKQGVVAQALAKVIDLDFQDGCIAVGLSIYLKTVYFVQYKIKHAGLCVPPKCLAIEECGDACKEFVEGDLLEQSIQPLEVCTKPKTINSKDFEPVEDPTPADEEAAEDRPKHKRSVFGM